VDENGNVKDVVISGKSISEKSMETISKLVSGWDFSLLSIKKEWQFIIKF